jgi:inner membrane protein
MDSFTQVVLGAAVGEAVLGKKVGNKAQLWGAIAGTIPDLDVFLSPLYSDVRALFVHRGFSHSIFFAIIAAPVLGFLINKMYKGREADFKDWTKLFFWAIFTHPLLDSFTNYGTGLFEPFSDYRVAFNTIFVVDPLYTLPMFICCLLVLFYNRKNIKRRRINWLGITLSSFYLVLTVVNKSQIKDIVEEDLLKKGIAYEEIMTMPAPFTNILWNVIVKKEDEYLVGYYSWWDEDELIDFKKIPQQEYLIKNLRNEREVQLLIEFSKGYYALQENEKGIIFNDLRFGTMNGWFDLSKDYIFSFIIKTNSGEVTEVIKKDPQYVPTMEDLQTLFRRIKGEERVFYRENQSYKK